MANGLFGSVIATTSVSPERATGRQACLRRMAAGTSAMALGSTGRPISITGCAGGADTGDTCLSDAQIAAIRVYGTPLFIPYRTGSGEFLTHQTILILCPMFSFSTK